MTLFSDAWHVLNSLLAGAYRRNLISLVHTSHAVMPVLLKLGCVDVQVLLQRVSYEFKLFLGQSAHAWDVLVHFTTPSARISDRCHGCLEVPNDGIVVNLFQMLVVVQSIA